MACRKCKREIPDDAVFCPWCGVKQEKKKSVKTRGNGTGCAYKRGKTWTAAVTVGYFISSDGKVSCKRKTKGGFATKTEALNYCQALYTLPDKKKKMTLLAVYEQWEYEHEPRVVPTTMAEYRSAFKWYKDIHYMNMSIIKAQDFQTCIDKCPRGKRVKEDMKTVAGLLCKWAYNNDVVDKNYAVNLFTGKDPKGTRPAFTMEEVEKIRQSVGVKPYADYVYVLIYTGFRPSELFALTKSSYRNGILVGGAKTEAGKDRLVPVSPKIRKIIEERFAANSEYLFPRDRQKMDESYFRKFCFVPLMKELGIEGRVPYSCRHTFANLLKNVHGSDTEKAALIGHADASMTKYYQSPEVEPLWRIIESL